MSDEDFPEWFRRRMRRPSSRDWLFGDVDDIKLADKLLENGVAAIPGSPFGSKGRGCLRFSYGAANMQQLEEAANRIEKTI